MMGRAPVEGRLEYGCRVALVVSRACAILLFNLGQAGSTMKDPYGLSKARIPASYAQILLEILAERGVAPARVLQDSRLPDTLCSVPDARITPREWSRLVWSALSLSGDESLGYEYGLRLRPTAHGVLGFAMMSSATIGQATELAAAFFSMRLPDYRIDVRTEGDVALIEFSETHPVVGAQPEQAKSLRRFFHECLMLGMIHAGRVLTGRDTRDDVEIWVDWPEPAYHARYGDRLPAMRFERPSNQIRWPAVYMQLPLALADPLALQQAIAQCENERARFAESIEDLAARVRAELVLEPGRGYPSLDAVAKRLHMSGRTLKRRLQALDVSYSTVLDEIRRREAEALLTTTDMDVQEIAALLGYLGPANFTRAFRKWTGMTPSGYREAKAAPSRADPRPTSGAGSSR